MNKFIVVLISVIWSQFSFSSVDIGNGTLVNQSIPIKTSDRYSYSQFIYTASEINASGSITSLTFKKGATSISASDDWTIYMGHTANSSFASTNSWVSSNLLTQVYSGTVSLVGNDVVVTLSSPFIYNGVSNLLIAVDENHTSVLGNGYDDFYCTARTSSRSIYYTTDNTTGNPNPANPPIANGLRNAIPNIEIGGITQSCVTPTDISITNITGNSANISWPNNSAIEYEIQYGPTGFLVGTGTTVSSNTNFLNLTSIPVSTEFDCYRRDICTISDTSSWSEFVSFTTLCGAYVPPYEQNFSSTLSCWSEFQGVLSPFNVNITNTYSNWGSGNFADVTNEYGQRVSVSGNGLKSWIVSPEIDLGTGSINYQLEVDVALTSLYSNNESNFGFDDSVALVISLDSGNTWVNANIIKLWNQNNQPRRNGETTIVDLSGYSGVVKFGFYASSHATNQSLTFHIDNFKVKEIPTCEKPLLIKSSNITENSIDFDWLSSTAISTEIEYGIVGFALGSGLVNLPTINNHVITGLNSNTDYSFYLKNICGVGDTSEVVSVSVVSTLCSPSIAPFIDDVEMHVVYDQFSKSSCWTTNNNSGVRWKIESGSPPSSSTGPSSPYSGNNYFYFESSGYNSDEYDDLYSPLIDISALNAPSFSYYYHRYGNDIDSLEVFIDDGNGWVKIHEVFGSDQSFQSNNWKKQVVNLSGYSGIVQVKLRGHRGSGYNGDFGIDDLAFEECNTTYSILDIVACDSFVSSNDMTYYTTGVYTETILNSIGCDSVITLNVSIGNTTFSNMTESVCSMYISPSGIAYFNSGIYNDTISNTIGCDSIITIDLTVSSSVFASTSTIDVSTCGNYYSPSGNYYDSTGVYVDTISNLLGCDSIITINLTNTNSASSLIITECNVYSTPSGLNLLNSGIYTDVIPNTFGCDSVITIDLTINPNESTNLITAECDLYTSPGGTDYTVTGSYTESYTNVYGCDSSFYLNLTVFPSYTLTVTENDCEEFVSPSGVIYNSTGAYQEVFMSLGGCDSLIVYDIGITNIDLSMTISQGVELTIGESDASTSYQWIDCDNNDIQIGGATEQTFTPNTNGSYACEVTKNGCLSISDCYTVTSVGLEDELIGLSIYPNPSNGLFIIESSNVELNSNLEVFNLAGQVVYRTVLVSQIQEINIHSLESGMYFIRLNNGNEQIIKSIVVNK